MTAIERCNKEIAECEAYLAHGGPEWPGALLGLRDWRMERELELAEERASVIDVTFEVQAA